MQACPIIYNGFGPLVKYLTFSQTDPSVCLGIALPWHCFQHTQYAVCFVHVIVVTELKCIETQLDINSNNTNNGPIRRDGLLLLDMSLFS